MTFTFFKKDFRPVILENVSQSGFAWCLRMIKFRLCTFGKNTTEMMFHLSQCFRSRGRWCAFVPLLAVLTLITYLRWYLPSFYKVTVFPFQFKVSCGKIPWNHRNVLIFIKHSPTSFSVYWCISAWNNYYGRSQMVIFQFHYSLHIY